MSRAASDHETHDAPPWIGVLGMGVIVGTVATALLLVGLVLALFHAASPGRPARAAPPRQGPLLEAYPGQGLAAVHIRGTAEAASYAWADPAHTTARIPIDRAMQITAQRGWADSSPGPRP